MLENMGACCKGYIMNFIALGLRFVYLFLITKEYIMDPYENCIICYRLVSIACTLARQHGSTHQARETALLYV